MQVTSKIGRKIISKITHLFYEFFHGDTGQGLGACHQTGWTALIVNLLLELDEE